MKYNYNGWELQSFDAANNFRDYQNKIIIKYIKGKVAEVGPGNGVNSELFLKRLKKLFLYEPSYKLYKNLKKKYKNKKKIKIFNSKFKKNSKKFDTILYLDVLEHILDHKKELNSAIFSLKRGGHLIINVPAFSFLYSNFDKDVGHYRRYSKKSIKKIINENNCKIMQLKYYDIIGFFLSLISKFLTFTDYRKNFRNKILLWDSLVPLSKFLDKILFNIFGKSLICVIKKTK